VLYTWLLYIHVLSVGAFLFVHGINGGASFLLRGSVTPLTRPLLMFSQRAGYASNPAILLVLITGVWMTFAGHWATRVWPWAAVAVLILTFAAMVFIARPYYQARDAAKGSDGELASRIARTRPDIGAGVGLVALLILFGLMVFKPF
jgi:uncharacterized membrane protein